MSFSIKFLIFTTTINLFIKFSLTDDYGPSCTEHFTRCVNQNFRHNTSKKFSCQHTLKNGYQCLAGDCGTRSSPCDIDRDKCCYGYYCGVSGNTNVCLPN